MSLSPGQMLAHYEILELIGKGGMGEVYRARDTKLGREVAIKVLPEEFAQDKDRVARFEREARLLASLNHPHIATLHGFEESDGQQFLVMELVEGETLAERIAAGPIPIHETLPLFKQIAEGLEAAHEKGVIHRDLKPANIKIGENGRPKILDFGLAKAYVGDEEPAPSSSQSPTLTRLRQGLRRGRHPARRDPGNGLLYEPGAGAWESGGQEDGHLGVRLLSLRIAYRKEALRRRYGFGHPERRVAGRAHVGGIAAVNSWCHPSSSCVAASRRNPANACGDHR